MPGQATPLASRFQGERVGRVPFRQRPLSLPAGRAVAPFGSLPLNCGGSSCPSLALFGPVGKLLPPRKASRRNRHCFGWSRLAPCPRNSARISGSAHAPYLARAPGFVSRALPTRLRRPEYGRIPRSSAASRPLMRQLLRPGGEKRKRPSEVTLIIV